jgi:uncharacterized protein (DUF1919 family)
MHWSCPQANQRLLSTVKKWLQALRRRMAHHRVKNENFAVVSNNCWGAHVYQNLNRPYASPFVGLFLSPTAYLRLLSNFPALMVAPLEFRVESEEAWINLQRAGHSHRWPIGWLGREVEVQFMHYRSEAEAKEKWQRRCQRMARDQDRWFFKFDDRDGCTKEQLDTFVRLPQKNKVLFTTRRDVSGECVVRIPLDQPCVPDGLELSRLSPRFFDAADWLKGGTGHSKPWTRWLNCL